jgi:hypothetical protein
MMRRFSQPDEQLRLGFCKFQMLDANMNPLKEDGDADVDMPILSSMMLATAGDTCLPDIYTCLTVIAYHYYCQSTTTPTEFPLRVELKYHFSLRHSLRNKDLK